MFYFNCKLKAGATVASINLMARHPMRVVKHRKLTPFILYMLCTNEHTLSNGAHTITKQKAQFTAMVCQ